MAIKVCFKCKIERQYSQFHKNTKTPDGLHSWCKPCRKIHDQERYKVYGSFKWQRSRGTSRQDRRKWFVKLKEKLKCEMCPETHPACLEFHHKDATEKSGTVSDMVSHGASEKRILDEIAKCQVLCSNCHQKLHYEERNENVL